MTQIMNFSDFFTFVNYPTIIILLCLTFFFMHDHTFPANIIRQFLLLEITITLLLISDSLYAYYSGFNTYVFGKKLFTIFGYILRPLALAQIITITFRNEKVKTIYYFIPTFVITFFCILNMFFPVIFYIDENNIFRRYHMAWVPYVTNFSLLFMMLKTLVKTYQSNFREYVFISAYTIAIVIATLMDAFEIAYCIVPFVSAMGTLFYFINLNIDLYKRDTLTKLYGRQSFESDCKKFSRCNTIIVSMDLNDLKKLNDLYGHKEGDNALLTSVKAMKDNFETLGRIYRTGGDEFMALFPRKNLSTVAFAISNFQREISKSKYQVAVGYAEYCKDTSFDDALNLSDSRMYQNKKMLKSVHNN